MRGASTVLPFSFGATVGGYMGPPLPDKNHRQAHFVRLAVPLNTAEGGCVTFTIHLAGSASALDVSLMLKLEDSREHATRP